MKITQTRLPGVIIIDPDIHKDERGFFLESYHESRYRQEAGIEETFVQDNHSRSTKGVLRGLHFQQTRPQGKLVWVTQGEVFDVAVDINPDSAAFRQWVSVKLSDNNYRQFYIPPGYAHGFLVISESVDLQYKCTAFYDSKDERGVLWSDKSLNIVWPVTGQPIVSEKDSKLPPLSS